MMETFRWLLRQKRDEVAKDTTQPNRFREFSYGLIYDALGWTKVPFTTLEHLDVIAEVVQIAEQPLVSKEDLMTIRKKLQEGGFNVTPQMAAKEAVTCPSCGHNMGRSRCKATGLDAEGNPTWRVRCNKCKTVYEAVARFPKV
jgi:hypothetical protein